VKAQAFPLPLPTPHREQRPRTKPDVKSSIPAATPLGHPVGGQTHRPALAIRGAGICSFAHNGPDDRLLHTSAAAATIYTFALTKGPTQDPCSERTGACMGRADVRRKELLHEDLGWPTPSVRATTFQ